MNLPNVTILYCNLFCVLDKIKKEEMCIGQQQKGISRMKIYTHKINPRLDQMHGPLHYKEKTNIKKLD